MSSDPKTTEPEPLEAKGWPTKHGYPKDMGGDWWHWLKNNLTGAYHCAWWERGRHRWHWILGPPILASRLPQSWDYLGPAMPPPAEVRKVMEPLSNVQ